MDKLYNFEHCMDEVCGECIWEDCDTCPVFSTYRRMLDKEFGEDFPTPITIHAIDSPEFQHNQEKWLARRHRKGDFKAKRQKVVVRQKDTGYLKDNRCTTRRKEALNDC